MAYQPGAISANWYNKTVGDIDQREAMQFQQNQIARQNQFQDEDRNYLAKQRKQEAAKLIASDAVDMLAGGENDETINAFMQARSAEEGLPYSPEVLSMVKGRFAQMQGGGEAYGSVVYGEDENGNVVAMQPTKSGKFAIPQAPQGVRITLPTKPVNLGGEQVFVDPRNPTQPVARYEVTPKPTETPDYQADVTTAKEAAKNAEKKRAGYPKVRDAVAATEQNANTVSSVIDKAGALIQQGRSSGWWSLAGGLPESQAKTLRALFQQIKANIGFNYLAEMRQNSPTGGAVGNLTEKEFELLASTAGTLDPSLDPEILLQILADMKNGQQRTITRMKSAYENDYADYMQQSGPKEVEGF